MTESAGNDLDHLSRKFLEMGSASEELVRDAVRALTQQDVMLADKVVSDDDVVDQLENEIESLCLRLMTRPLSIPDFRLVGAALKSITDIERIGDHAVDISRIARRMQHGMLYKPLADIPQMGEMVCRMLSATVNSFVSCDSVLASSVLASEGRFDALCSRTQAELQTVMSRDADALSQASYLLFVVHYLERIGDHCANIAERVTFIETGKRQKVRRETRLAEAPQTTSEGKPKGTPPHLV